MLLDSPQIGTTRGPQPKALTASLVLHAALIGWMFFGPSLGGPAPQQPQKNAYQQLIAGSEKKLVWYSFKDKLPEVSPLERKGISQPPRSDTKAAKQTIVANPPRAKRAKQMVYLPAAPEHLQNDVPAPNLLAFAVPKIPPPEKPSVKLFAPPPEVIAKLVPPEPLPDAPQLPPQTAKLDLPQPDALPKPQPKQFVPPAEAKREAAPPAAVPEAPKISTANAAPQLEPRRFVPPPETKRSAAAASMPEAPKVGPTQASVSLPQPQKLRARQFVPPPESHRATAPASMPDAPKVTSATAKLTLPPAPRLAPRKFVPPARTSRPSAPIATPDAPKIASTSAKIPLPSAPKLAPRKFVPPSGTGRSTTAPTPSTPDAPKVASAGGSVALPTASRLAPRAFVAPAPTHSSGTTGSGSIPDAPTVAGGTAAPAALPSTPRLPPREFNPPADAKPSPATAAILPDAPQVVEGAAPESTPAGSLTAAIVGLQPAPELKALPEAARPADVSSAPNPRKEGGTGEPVESAKLFVPNLMIRDGAIPEPTAAAMVKGIVKAASSPASLDNIMQASRSAPIIRPAPGLASVLPAPDAPDASFNGRNVYMASIQMPTITSFIGSWIMWFADREPMPGDVHEMRPPVPIRKVDPKYVASAAAERVQGKVQLSAVIRRDGHVDSVTVLKHLDDRLDFSAAEALAKWEFEPARRDGRAVDVDAVFEIPFQLEPLAKR